MSLIDRDDAFSGSDAAQATVGGVNEAAFAPTYTNQPHREWLHRPAFLMGRTLIGMEVQKVLAAVEVIFFISLVLQSAAILPYFSELVGDFGPIIAGSLDSRGPEPAPTPNRSFWARRGRTGGNARRSARGYYEFD